MNPMPQPADSFAGKLQRWREQRGLKQTDAAETLGVPYRTYVNWEQSKRTPPDWQQQMLLMAMEPRRKRSR